MLPTYRVAPRKVITGRADRVPKPMPDWDNFYASTMRSWVRNRSYKVGRAIDARPSLPIPSFLSRYISIATLCVVRYGFTPSV